MDVEEIVRNSQGTIIDVRTSAEYYGGHVKGSINIPLNEISARIEEIHSLEMPLVLCCASGGRSQMATQMLSDIGIACCNGGSWITVNNFRLQTAQVK